MDHLICVFDTETTGFPKKTERIVEIAMVLLDLAGNVVDQFETLVNPQRDVGPTNIHGVSASDVANAPVFDEIVGDVAAFMQRATVLAAHNARFDKWFIEHEFSRAGHELPDLQAICTMQLFGRKKLERLCHDYDIELEGEWHCAMADTVATARLLALFLESNRDEIASLIEGIEIDWPAFPDPSGRRLTRQASAERKQQPPSYLSRIAEGINHDSEGESDDIIAYATIIENVLADRIIDSDEETILVDAATSFGLSHDQVTGVHKSFLDNLIVSALADGVVTNAERHDLETVAKLLGISTTQLDALLESASNKLQRALSGRNQQALGKDLAGKSVCITGALLCTIAGERIDRSTAYTLSEQAGLIPMQSVTKKLDLLVTADASTQSGKMKKARRYGLTILAEPSYWSRIGVVVD